MRVNKLQICVALICLSISVVNAQNNIDGNVSNDEYITVVKDIYDNAMEFSEGLAAVRIDNKWGFIDTTGKVVIEPQFNPWQAQFNTNVSDGLVAVNFSSGKRDEIAGNDPVNTKWGFADKTGKIVILPQFEGSYWSPPVFSEGLALIYVTNFENKSDNLFIKYGYIDKSGNFAIKPKFEEAHQFSDGLASVKIGNKFGFINKNGKIVIAPIYDQAYYFYSGLAVVILNNKYFLIDKKNNKMFGEDFEYVDTFHDGMALFRKNGKIGFIDRSGAIKIKPIFDASDPLSEAVFMKYSEGLCAVQFGYSSGANKRDGKWGYINKTGDLVINPKFDNAYRFRNGVALVELDGKYGYIDKSGKFLIKPIFTNAGEFRDGIARVSNGPMFVGKFGYIKMRP